MDRRRAGQMVAWMLACVALACGSAAAAGVEDCVPAEAILVLKVTDLGGNYARLCNSAQVKDLLDSGAAVELSAKLQEARRNLAELERQHDVKLDLLVNDLFGREFAIAAAPGKPGVFIARGYNAASLQAAVDVVRKIQKAGNPNESETTSVYKGVTIHSGVGTNGGHYALVGDVLVASQSVPAVEKVLDVMKGDAQPITALGQYKRASTQMQPGALANCYLDASVLWPLAGALSSPEAYRKLPPKLQNPVMRYAMLRLAEILPQMSYMVLTVSTDNELRIRLAVAYNGDKLPQSLANFLPAKGSRLSILDLTPKGAVFSGGRNVNLKALWNDMMVTLKPVDPEGAQRLRDLLQQVISMCGGIRSEEQFFAELGNQAALFVLPGAGGDDLPAGAAALELRDTTHIPDALASIMGALAVLTTADKKDVKTSTALSDYQGVALRTVKIEAAGPAGKLSPTLFVVDGKVVLTTSSSAAQQIIDASRQKRAAEKADESRTAIASARLDVVRLREVLRQYRELIVSDAEKKHGKSRAKAEQDYAALDGVLSLFSSVEMESAWRPGLTEAVVTARYGVPGEGPPLIAPPGQGAGKEPAAQPDQGKAATAP